MTAQDRSDKLRIWFVAVTLLLCLVGLGVKLCFLHLGNHSKISRNWETRISPKRGTIYDCNGRNNPMAVTLTGRYYFLDTQLIDPNQNSIELAERIAEVLQIDTDFALAAVNRKGKGARYVKLAFCMDDHAYDLLSDKKKFSGIAWEPQTIRHYPQGRRMAHVLGFTNKAGEGISGGAGIEQKHDALLRGTAGLIQGELDAFRNEIWRRRKCDISAINGANVSLTLDQNIQYIVEKELMDVCEQFHATAAWAIVQRVKTGAILALACLPDFDPNQYGKESSDVWRNAAIGEVYEPGSTMKAMVVAAALNEKIITPESTIDVGAGTMFYGGRILRDHVQGVIDISTLIQKSSNIGAAKLGLMLNNRRLEAYFRGFGFGSKSGIDLPGEEQGIFMPHRQWSKLTPTRIPIGQGISVTALQMLGAYCAIANNGQLMWPHVVEKIESQDGEILYQAEPKVIARPIRPEVAETVRKMLVRVTETGGTAKSAAVAHYTVAGKTGTAQIPIRGGYSNTDYWASFVGFCPAESSEFGVIVVVERPKPKYHGGYVAAPVFAKITEAVANYLEIPSNLDKHAEDKTSIVKKSEFGAPANHNAVVWSSTP